MALKVLTRSVPRSVNANVQMRESYLEFILSECKCSVFTRNVNNFGRMVLDELQRICKYFQPPPPGTRQALVSRMKRSEIILGFMYLGAKVFEALTGKAQNAVARSCIQWVDNYDRQVTSNYPPNLCVQAVEDRLVGLLEVGRL
jgi:hypothetical protein